MKFEENLVSVITPVYNAERFISETIDSVLNQTYTNIEHILINDRSSDNSLAILEEYAKKDSRIKIINHEENQGAAVARNNGIAAAKGQYIAFVDSDDIWLPEKTATQISFMKENDYSFTYTGFASITEDGEILKDNIKIPLKLDYHGLLKNTAIACSTVIIDRNAVGDFRMPNVRKGQDVATWLYLMRERDVIAYGLREVFEHYRQVQGSLSNNKFGALKRTWHVYYNIEDLPFLKAAYYFVHYAFNATMRRL